MNKILGEIMTILTASKARNSFAQLCKEAEKEVVQVTQHNKPSMAVMSWDYYQSLIETLEILSEPETLDNIKRGERDLENGNTIEWSKVKAQLTSGQ
jgi:prevent-host-death family protein